MSTELSRASKDVKKNAGAFLTSILMLLIALKTKATNAWKGVDLYEAYPVASSDSMPVAATKIMEDMHRKVNRSRQWRNFFLLLAAALAILAAIIINQPPKTEVRIVHDPYQGRTATVTVTRTIYPDVNVSPIPSTTPKTSSVYPSPPANATASSSYTPTTPPLTGGYVGDFPTPVPTWQISTPSASSRPTNCVTRYLQAGDGTLYGKEYCN